MRPKPNQQPDRLINHPDIGPLLREADAVTFDDNRLQQNRATIFARLSTETATPVTRHWPRLFERPRLVLVGLAVLLLSTAGASAALYWGMSTSGSAAGADTDTVQHESGRAAVDPADGTLAPIGGDADQIAENIVAPPTPESETAIDSASQGKSRRGAKAGTADNTLDEQLRLFNKAKKGLATGNLSSALRHLERLKQRYPEGPLDLEAKELTAHVLAGLHRYGEASRAINGLLKSGTSTRKKAQLYRFLGDLQVKQDRCDRAVESYRRALGLGLSTTESEAARSGIRNCTP